MMLEFIQEIGTFSLVLILILFVVFLILIKKVMKTVINIIIVSAASAAFPLVLRFLGFSIPFNLDTILFFLILGLGLYMFYLLGKIIYSALGIVEKSAKIVTSPFRGNELEKKVEKIIEKKEKKKEQEKES
jgi:hypothetical protein